MKPQLKHNPGGHSHDQSNHGKKRGASSGGGASEKPSIKWRPKVDPADFIQMRNRSKYAEFLSPIEPSDLEGHKLILSEDGTVGVAVSPEGDIQNVFNNGGPKGAARYALIEAIDAGGKTLDCYDGHLPKFYANFGFTETGRMTFAREYAPETWDYDRFGEPDVVFMARTEPLSPDEMEKRASERSSWKPPERSDRIFAGEEWDEAKRVSVEAASDRGSQSKSWAGADGTGGEPVGSAARLAGRAVEKAIGLTTFDSGFPSGVERKAIEDVDPESPEFLELIREIQAALSVVLQGLGGRQVKHMPGGKQHDQSDHAGNGRRGRSAKPGSANSPWSDWNDPEAVAAVSWRSPSPGKMTSEFSVAGKQFQSIVTPVRSLKGAIRYDFAAEEGADEITGRGDAYAVMKAATIRAASSLGEHDPDLMQFASRKDQPSRVDLYRFMAIRANRLFPDRVGVRLEIQNATSENFALIKQSKLDEISRRLGERGVGVHQLTRQAQKSFFEERLDADFWHQLLEDLVGGHG